MKNKRLYRIWKNMRTRCSNSNFPAYKYYGGKGVTTCEEWDEFYTFQEWSLNHGYTDELTIDRIDGDGNYSPLNCRWVDMVTQQNNKSNRVVVTVNNEELTIKEVAEKYNINHHTVLSRYSSGIRGDKLTNNVRESKRICIEGEHLTLLEISQRFDIPWSTIRDRYRKGLRDVRITQRKIEKGGVKNAR